MSDIVETEPGVFSILIDGSSFEARVCGNEILIDGQTFEITDPRQWKRSASSAAAGGLSTLTAPMPGKVVRLLVAMGEDVEAGQGLMVVEAMKMQNEIKAPRAGRVTAINVKQNDSVTAGAVLIAVESTR